MTILPGLTVGALAALAYRVPPPLGGSPEGKHWDAPPAMAIDPGKGYSATLRTSEGELIVDLLAEEAPKTVNNFVFLAREGFYNGTTFHRFANLTEQQPGAPRGDIIQGGDPLSKDPATRASAGAGGPGYEVPREYNALKHDRLPQQPAPVTTVIRAAEPTDALATAVV